MILNVHTFVSLAETRVLRGELVWNRTFCCSWPCGRVSLSIHPSCAVVGTQKPNAFIVSLGNAMKCLYRPSISPYGEHETSAYTIYRVMFQTIPSLLGDFLDDGFHAVASLWVPSTVAAVVIVGVLSSIEFLVQKYQAPVSAMEIIFGTSALFIGIAYVLDKIEGWSAEAEPRPPPRTSIFLTHEQSVQATRYIILSSAVIYFSRLAAPTYVLERFTGIFTWMSELAP